MSLRAALFLLLFCAIYLLSVHAVGQRPTVRGSSGAAGGGTTSRSGGNGGSTGGGSGGVSDDDDVGEESEKLRDAERRLSDFESQLNSTQKEALKKYREQLNEVEKILSDNQQERLQNLTQKRNSHLRRLTQQQYGVFVRDGVDKLAEAGVLQPIVKVIREAQEALENFIEQLKPEQKRAVRKANELRLKVSRLLGHAKMRELQKLEDGKKKVFEDMKIPGLSKWQKARAGQLEFAMERFVCRNLTKLQRHLYYYANHLRRTLNRQLPDKLHKILVAAELNETRAKQNLTKEQRKKYDESGLAGLKDDKQVNPKNLERLKKATKALNTIIESLKPRQKEMYQKFKHAMKNFTRSITEVQRHLFQGINVRLRDVYRSMTRSQANILRIRLHAKINSPCHGEDKQGRVDRLVDWLKDATEKEKKKNAAKLQDKIQTLVKELKLLERMMQLNQQALRIQNNNRSRCKLHYDKTKDHMTIVRFGGRSPAVAYRVKMTSSGDVTWSQMMEEDLVKDLVEKLENDDKDVQEITKTSGETWKMSRGKLELQKNDKENFRPVGVCHCSGCDLK